MPRVTTRVHLANMVPLSHTATPATGAPDTVDSNYGFIVVRATYTRNAEGRATSIAFTVVS